MTRCMLAALGSVAIFCSTVRAENANYSVRTLPAAVVKTEPEAGDMRVDPGITEIRVRFSKRMKDKNWSWVQISDDTFPEMTGDPKYLADGRTCVLPVKLKPGRTYVLELNSRNGRFSNFKDRQGQPSVPYLLVFETARAGAP